MPQFAASISLASLDGANGFRLDGIDPGDNSGQSVSAAGDVNGDGFDDILIGAPGGDPGLGEEGESYVVFGKASGFPAGLSLLSIDGTNGFRLTGEAAFDRSGGSVASAGDVNGDGFADLIVGANGADPNGARSGASHVVFGKASGFAANLDLSSLNGTNGFQISGEMAYDFSGVSVASAGDVNGDGFADLIAGANGTPYASYSGASYVVFGRASGFAANLDLSTLNGANGFQVSGEADGDTALGISVASAGDMNGDGFSDLIVGALGANPNGTDSGASYVIFGHRALVSVIRIGTDIAQTQNGGFGADIVQGRGGDDTLLGWESNDDIEGGDGRDTIDGGGGADTIDGGTGNDTIDGGIGRAGDTIDGGAGNDTIEGGGGKDTLTGGEGLDRFDYDAIGDSEAGSLKRDIVLDFTAQPFMGTAFHDKLDFATIDARAGTLGNQAFTFIGAAAFTAEGQIRAAQSGSTTLLQLNISGTTGAEMEVELKSFTAATLQAVDFVL